MPALSRGSAVTLGVALALLGFVLACGPSETEQLDQRWEELGVPEAEFVFLGEFTANEQEVIRRELRVAQVVFAEHFGTVTSDFTVYVSTDLDVLNERIAADRPDVGPVWFTCGGLAPRHALLLVLEGCLEEIRALGGPVAHEYFHILQWHVGRLEPIPQRLWLVEGSAVYASALVEEVLGRRSLETRREAARLVWSSMGEGFPHWGDLSEAEYSAHLYHIGFLAAEWLAERAGPEAILEFFRLGSHNAAFHRAFDIPLEGFYAAFEEHRLEVAPPLEARVAGTVLDSGGQPVGGLDVFAMVRIEGEAWTAGGGETDRQGMFEFAAPESAYTIAVWLQCPLEDGSGGWAYAGEWGEEGFVADGDGILDPRADGAEPFTDGERDRSDLVIELPWTRSEVVDTHCES